MRSAFLWVAIVLVAFPVHGEPTDAGEPPTPLSAEVEVGTSYYPQQLADSGAHGTVVLKVQLDDDGKLVDYAVAETSGSDELDKLATTYVRQLKFSPVDGKPLAKNVLLSVQFVKDSIASLPKKTCADFSADLAFERKRSPEVSVKDMRAFSLAAGLQPSTSELPKKQQRKMARKLEQLPAEIEQACAANPSSKFLDVFVSGLKK